ncbi:MULTISPECIES: IMPACT family protein [unclassified Agrococcus]|uniref:IMPACT family protein n=1 Tax=unclassified Agrococcus TaxID=2615065 RepID=UPI003611C5BF
MPVSLLAPVDSELVVRRSRFVGRIEPVAGRDEAVRIVAALRQRHPDAAHVCWALLAGGESAAVDDGEPSGTAARPMMDVLRHNDVDGALATVVRWFGGVRLGAGGLVRAYSTTTSLALQQATLVPVRRTIGLSVAVPYALEGALRRELDASGATLDDVTHGADVVAVFTIDEQEASSVIARVDDLAQGRARWRR